MAALANRPQVKPWLQDVYLGFWRLVESRPTGMGVGHVPFSEMRAYLEFAGVGDPDDREEWLLLLRALDAEYLRHVREEQRREEQRQKTRRSGGQRG